MPSEARKLNQPGAQVQRRSASHDAPPSGYTPLRLLGMDAESTRAMVAAIDARDPYTRAHSVSVAAYAEAIGRRMGLSGLVLESLRKAALLHDIGKIGVPDAILTKPGPLTADEFNTVKRHPEIAIEILGHLSFLEKQLPLILHHHERYDGRGYPSGLIGDRIPIGARILAVADALDTMFSPRTYKSAYKIDPFSVPLEKKVDLLLRINEKALQVKGARFVSSALYFVGEDKFFASTEGSVIQQDIVRSDCTFTVTAVDATKGEFASRDSLSYPAQRGWEWIEEYPYLDEAPQAAEEAVEKLRAKPVAPGKYDLLLDPTHLFLTIHESCGHPTELDRALGYEANFAGTSFLTPDKLGKFRYGSKWINMIADRTQPYGLSTVGYDDDGVAAQRWFLIRDGIFVDYQTTREQVAWIPGMTSRGSAHADSWSSVVFQRMPNVSLDPMDSKLTQEELIAGIKDGILIIGAGSFSIDQQRYNFQFGGQVFWEIKNGRKTQMLRDVAYQARTSDFWNSCDGVAGRNEYLLCGVLTDGKGEPGQSNPVSHGCPPARFRQVNVINTGRSRA